MSTRAIQIEFLLSGLIDPTTGDPLTGGTVYFYEAGTLTEKEIWTEKEKTNPYTSYTLATGGLIQLYGDGIYKVIVKDSDSATIFVWDDIKIRAHNFSVVSKIADYVATVNDDVILVNNSAGHVTITLPSAATMEYPITVIHTKGSNNVILDPNAAETIDGAASYTFSSINSAVTAISDGSNLLKSGNVALGIVDGATITLANTGLHILDTNASHDLIIAPGSDLTADRTLTLTTGDVDRTLAISSDVTMDQNVDSTASPTFADVTLNTTALLATGLAGYKNRSKFSWKDGDEIYIDAGCYHHSGTINQLVYWTSQLTFMLQSGGSNADSNDYGVDGWHYIYLDDSAIVTQASPLLDADCFINSTTAPTWSATKMGWYNPGSAVDKCIFAVYETGGAILEFFHDGGDYVQYADRITDLVQTDIDTTWTDIILTIPGFSISAQVYFLVQYVDGGSVLYWRTNGQTGTSGHRGGFADITSGYSNVSQRVITDASQTIEVKLSVSNANTMIQSTMGFYFPTGM